MSHRRPSREAASAVAHKAPQSAFARALFVAVLLAAASLAAVAHAGAINRSRFTGVAIDGYDPVAYFTEGRPARGSDKFEHEWMGATWRFATAANRDAFAQNPEKYAPAYGGYCAYAVAHGTTADIDPAAWAIVRGRLYLNLSPEIKAEWEKDRENYIRLADANWPKIEAELTK